MTTKYLRQLITKDGIRGPLEEITTMTPEVKREIKSGPYATYHEAMDAFDGYPAVNCRTYKYRRQVQCVVYEYEEE